MKNKIKIVLTAAVFIVCGILHFYGNSAGDVEIQSADSAGGVSAGTIGSIESSNSEKAAGSEGIIVYVCGAVRVPGVYELSTGERVSSAVELAGGLKQDAASESINLAARLSDGERIYIPYIGEDITPEQDETLGSGKIDINSAGKDELMTLAGIGSAKADAIIKYRDSSPFTSIEDIMKVPGIKEGAFEKIKEQIVAK